ncbi:uncharacterized protein [Nicotiana sylvestris]|uniref:uncharacterized protein n=1 Tax=Nicotiana sylvestris TaxID=4096 RepID=UPI00388CC300
MVKKNVIEALDSFLKDIMDTNILFGGKVVVFDGDFRQSLPVVRSGKKKDFIRESILNSEIWNELEKLRLSENMRAKTDPSFCEYLMRIGNGKEKTNMDGKIKIPRYVKVILQSKMLPHLGTKRYKIGVGTAEGLRYLHEGDQRITIHRDIKAANILLTKDFESQIFIVAGVKESQHFKREQLEHGIQTKRARARQQRPLL